MSTIQRDLAKNAEDRLEKWFSDTIMRGEIVDLSRVQMCSTLMFPLLRILSDVSIGFGVDKHTLLKFVDSSYKEQLKEAPVWVRRAVTPKK